MDQDLLQLIFKIKEIKKAGQFTNYIDFIQFPFYRNLELDTRITFDFPLTVFVGQNGCGKSSCLHALYGSPDGYTPYRFWFDTKVDPVNYYDEKRKRHSFWYSFKKGNITKEVIKARIKRNNDPNYWETSRPLRWAGMQTRKKKNDRDKPIKKNVVYLDFRSELSAFDKFFYFGSVKNRKSKNKQEFLRKKSSSLNKLFKRKKKFINSSTRSLNEEAEEIPIKELYWISFILGRTYNSGIIIKHSLFHNEGYSVLFSTEFARYSEAVAGSGEMAIVRLVKEIMNADKESLILLDEPEVSLHPGAQERLKHFLLEQIKLKKHQIILTTHSPSLINGLPKESLKVFYQNPTNGRFLIKENVIPEQAFFHLELIQENKKNIVVEDFLAKLLIEGTLFEMGEDIKNLFSVSFNSGGESVLKNEFIKTFCLEKKIDTFVIFDGDQKPVDKLLDWRDFSQKDLNETFLKNKIREQHGVYLKFSINSNSKESERIEPLKKYLDFFLQNVFYLPKNIPEEVIWDYSLAKSIIKTYSDSETEYNLSLKKLESLDFKEKYVLLSNLQLRSSSSENIKAIHKSFLTNWLNKKNEDYHFLVNILNQISELKYKKT